MTPSNDQVRNASQVTNQDVKLRNVWPGLEGVENHPQNKNSVQQFSPRRILSEPMFSCRGFLLLEHVVKYDSLSFRGPLVKSCILSDSTLYMRKCEVVVGFYFLSSTCEDRGTNINFRLLPSIDWKSVQRSTCAKPLFLINASSLLYSCSHSRYVPSSDW